MNAKSPVLLDVSRSLYTKYSLHDSLWAANLQGENNHNIHKSSPQFIKSQEFKLALDKAAYSRDTQQGTEKRSKMST